MTLPVSKGVADVSLDAAIIVYVARHPVAMRRDIECGGAVAAILARTNTVAQTTKWLGDRLQHLRLSGVIERRRYHHGWFVVNAEAVAS